MEEGKCIHTHSAAAMKGADTVPAAAAVVVVVEVEELHIHHEEVDKPQEEELENKSLDSDKKSKKGAPEAEVGTMLDSKGLYCKKLEGEGQDTKLVVVLDMEWESRKA